MTVVSCPGMGLSDSDLEALRRECARRRGQGLPGHVAEGRNQAGFRWAAILDGPDGSPLHHFCCDQGVYYLLDFSDGGPGRLVHAGRDFRAILQRLVKRTDR